MHPDAERTPNGVGVPTTPTTLTVAAPRHELGTSPAANAQWPDRLIRLLTQEVRAAVAGGLLTAAEGEQLLARLTLVIDQAMTPTRP
ncbi:hypothetical protein [Pseudonocardia asaccharolytica]|uniref:Uncharacterized protein n=1 Tax=Pseudonocardia asaccharolytica DSM 44247 = NBRC 16224 TaxID=1123024 RepID=A0A511D4R2_9PSEU|nr:hypothetical protein [Pseudonocardia asaccharolytica]GEL19765.1 hypothetical protein PA7_36020 [Pseudonocardia asaccharolytica DSM 44247 = NBRC 16224]